MSGKTNLTYEEALACEHRAAAKAQQLPKEFIAPVLRMIQHSMVKLLADYVTFFDIIFKMVHLHACNILFCFCCCTLLISVQHLSMCFCHLSCAK